MKQVMGANYRLVVRPSPIDGDGMFAGEAIPWGRKIIEYKGEVIPDAEASPELPYEPWARGAQVEMSVNHPGRFSGPQGVVTGASTKKECS